MKRIIIPILLAFVIFPSTGLARFSIPSDIQHPKRFNPTDHTKGGMTDEECNKRLEKYQGYNKDVFCKGSGVVLLKYYLKGRHRMMNLVQATANGDFLFVWLKSDKRESLQQTVFDFRRKHLDMQRKNSGLDIYNGTSGPLRMYAYFVDTTSGTAYVLQKKDDYKLERMKRNSETAHKYVQQAKRYIHDLITRFCFPKIREYDNKIKYLKAMAYLCCDFNVYSHGGWPKMQNYRTNLD